MKSILLILFTALIQPAHAAPNNFFTTVNKYAASCHDYTGTCKALSRPLPYSQK